MLMEDKQYARIEMGGLLLTLARLEGRLADELKLGDLLDGDLALKASFSAEESEPSRHIQALRTF